MVVDPAFNDTIDFDFFETGFNGRFDRSNVASYQYRDESATDSSVSD